MHCTARASLGMHFKLSRGDRPMQRANGHPFVPRQHRDQWRSSIVLVSGWFSATFEPHHLGTVVGSDSVAERIAPLLLMLTSTVYPTIHGRATEIPTQPAHPPTPVPGTNLTPTAHQPDEPGWCTVVQTMTSQKYEASCAASRHCARNAHGTVCNSSSSSSVRNAERHLPGWASSPRTSQFTSRDR